ncbi:MAG: FAD-dependent monooxygenase [Pseudomonadales bacterium]
MTTTVLIAGGGIGGLTAALALAQEHCDIHVFEQADGFDEVGAGIQLSPNCVHVLYQLGLSQGLAKVASEPEALEIRHFKDGHRIARSALGETARRSFGYPYYHVHRADLLKVLSDTAGNTHNITLHTNTRIEGYHTYEDTVSVEVDNRTYTGNALIGADGIRSTIRARLFGEEPARYTGNVAWRALIPANRVPANTISPTATLWWGPNRHFVHYYVRGGQLINCVCVIEKHEQELESWDRRGDLHELKTEFSGWHGTITTLIESIDPDTCFKWGLFDRPPMPAWSRGNIGLLGDACHPTLPFMAQGAAMAIEDAAVLAACIGKFDHPGTAFAEYERLRKPRTEYVQKASRRNARIFHMATPLRGIRDMLAGPAQTRVMNKLFDYDPYALVNESGASEPDG